ncbi:MAG TPA: alpha/beta fold hydrolase [Methylomirabilota bacterium]|jgi:pimeloyl-ACP methyl ester carboxylesterase
MEDGSAEVEGIEARAVRAVAPVASGAMVFRAWGHGPPLVLLHGASGSWTHWIRNVLPLARRFRVLAADMPGYGESEVPPEPHTADALADLVAAGLDRVLPPPADFDLAGFSFGAIVGGLVAARLGARVRTLVMIGPGGLGLTPAPARALLRLEPGMDAEAIRRVHRENLLTLMLAQRESADELAVTLQIDNVRRSRFKSGSIPVSDVLRRALPAVRAHLVAIWGGRDAFTGHHLAESRRVLAETDPTIETRVIAPAGHWVNYEAAAEVNALLIEWLTRRRA